MTTVAIAIPALFIAAGICLYAAVSHVTVGLMRRPRDLTHLVFAGLCLAAVVQIGCATKLFEATAIPEFVTLSRWSVEAALFMFALTAWFIHRYTGSSKRYIPWGLSSLLLPGIVLNLSEPFTLLWVAAPQLRRHPTPWGEIITLAAPYDNALAALYVTPYVLTVVYAIYALSKYYLRQRSLSSLGMLSAFCVLLMSALHGVAIRLGLIDGVPSAPVVFTLLPIAMSLLLSHESRVQDTRLRAVLDHVPSLVFMKTIDGRYLWVNRSFCEFAGLASDRIIGRMTTDISRMTDLGMTDLGMASDHDQKVLAARTAMEFEEIIGSDSYLSLRFPVPGDDGSPVALCGVATNITRRKKAEEALQETNQHLEDLVEERTRQLSVSNKDLRLATDAAQNASRAKSAFLSNMSHELRTPLNAVIGFSRLMEKSTRLDAEDRKKLGIINRSGNHLLTLINDVLELSRIEAGQARLTEEDTNLGALLEEVSDILRMRAEQSGLTLALLTDGLPGNVRVDAMKLRQILINLLGNAVKFTREGGITFTIKGVAKGSQAAQVDFAVRDTGIGVAPEDQQKIFEPFVQMVTHATSAGTGLGLAITRQHIQMLGGELSLDSVPGHGATFRFSLLLPIVESPFMLTPVSGRVTGLDAGDRGRKIMIVDDTADARLLLRALLEPLGFALVEAADGEEALAQIGAFAPELVITDWRMPKMDGLELVKRIRAHLNEKQPKIVMLSANALEEQRQEALKVGVDGFLRKPLQEEELHAAIETFLDLRFQRQAENDKSIDLGTLTVDAKALAALPETLREPLKKALEELDPAKLSETLAELAKLDPNLAQGIATMAAQYRYNELWELMG